MCSHRPQIPCRADHPRLSYAKLECMAGEREHMTGELQLPYQRRPLLGPLGVRVGNTKSPKRVNSSDRAPPGGEADANDTRGGRGGAQRIAKWGAKRNGSKAACVH